MDYITTRIKKRKWSFVAGALVGVLAAVVFMTSGVRGDSSLPALFSPHPALAANAAGIPSLSDVAERSLPSVVNIASARRVQTRVSPFESHPFFREFFGQRQRRAPNRMQRAQGSGVIISADGIVLTNNHVVDKADDIKVVLSDKREFHAKVVGTDPKSDLAVLRLKGAKNLKPLPLGNSDALRLGEVVLAIGNPFGVGQTVTMGIVSAKGRAEVGIVDYEDFIQTDAAINPGNSGGALINMRGELVGINTAIHSRSGGYQGIGFAIPSNMARPIADSLLKRGKVVRSWLGVGIQQTSPDLLRELGLPRSGGALISHVEPGGPAHKAGIRRDDLVVAVNGRKVDSPARLRNIISSSGVGKVVQVKFYRGGTLKTLRVKLGELPTDPRAKLSAPPDARSGDVGGLTVAPTSKALRKKFKIPRRLTAGLVVAHVNPNSAGAAAGIRPGDVLLEGNRRPMRTVAQFSTLYKKAKNRVLLLVYRRGMTSYILLNK